MSLDPYEPESDYYFLLDIRPSAADSEVKRAFYRAIRKVHPDLNAGQAGSNAETQQINRAKILLDAKLRAEYDRLRSDYWAARRDLRPARGRPVAKSRRRRRPSARLSTKAAALEAWTHLAMGFLQGLIGKP